MSEKYWFLFAQGQLLLQTESTLGRCRLPLGVESPLQPVHDALFIPDMGGHDAVIAEVECPEVLPTGYQWIGLRKSYYHLEQKDYLLAGKAAELLNWHQANHFCGYCGAPLQQDTPISKRCPSCNKEVWPRLSPAIIVLIRRGDEVLLVQSKSFKSDYYGLVAGFVETGESLEEAVYREVREETGLEIRNLRYFGSQPWPYPRGLMVGFTADYLSGELHLQSTELNKGGWFNRQSLPAIPEKLSMARMLIDDWLEKLSTTV